jgi:hypothetical protein
MRPARLHERELLIDEVRHSLAKEVGGGHEVRVEDRDEFAVGHLQPRGERTSLVACAIAAMDVADVEPACRLTSHRQFCDVARFVGRVVEYLNLEQLFRIVERAHRVDQPIDDVHLIEDRELHGDDRPLRQLGRRARYAVAMLLVLPDEVIPMPSVDGQNRQDEEIRDEDDGRED